MVQVFPGGCEAHDVRGGPGLREAHFRGLAYAIHSCFVMVCGVERRNIQTRENLSDDATLDNYHNYLVSCQLSHPAIVHSYN